MNALKYVIIAYVLIEVPTFIVAAHFIGGLAVILLVLLTTFLGFYLLKRWQLSAVQLQMSRTPREQMQAIREVSNVRRLIASILLIVPGLVTDIIGLVLLFINPNNDNDNGPHQTRHDTRNQNPNDQIIEGEYEEK